MKRPLKILIGVVLALAILAIIAFVGAGIYVQSNDGRQRIVEEIGKALNIPLEAKRATLSWGTLQLMDVRVASGEDVFLTAPVFSSTYELLPLLKREVVLRKITLQNPTVTWPKNDEGKWVLPTRGPKVAKVESHEPKEHSDSKKFQVALDTLEIQHGNIEMLDEKRERFAFGQELRIDASLATAGEVHAKATAESIAVLQRGPIFDKVTFPFDFVNGVLTFPKIEGGLGGGSVHGSVAIHVKEEKTPFDLQLQLANVDLAKAIADPEWQIHSGNLQATLALKGRQKDFDRGLGKGDLRITEASVDAIEPLLRLIGETCHVSELASLNLSLQGNLKNFSETLGLPEMGTLKEASSTFEIGEHETRLDKFVVDSGDVQVTAKGTIYEEGKLDLAANLNISDKLVKKLPSFARDAIQPVEGTTMRGVAFNITGKNNRPTTNLFDKLLGQQVGGQFSSIVDSIFGSRSKDKDKDKEKEKAEKDEKKKKEKEERKAVTNAEKEKKKQEDAARGTMPPGATPAAGVPPKPEPAEPKEPDAVPTPNAPPSTRSIPSNTPLAQ